MEVPETVNWKNANLKFLSNQFLHGSPDHKDPTSTKMADTKIEYYFSKVVLLIATVFFGGSIYGLLFLFFLFYKENLPVAVILILPLIVLIIGLPDYIRFMYCAITGKPALILRKDTLINNANGQEYKWSQIKSISYKPHTGFRAPPGGYISIVLRDNGYSVGIPQNSIKCKTQKLLHDLQKFHRAYHREQAEAKKQHA